jgi:hypothetical protein
MAADLAGGRVVLFGGEGFNERNELVLLDDTWTWQSAGGPALAQPPPVSGSDQTRSLSTSYAWSGSALLVGALGVALMGAGFALRRSRRAR